MKISFLFNIQSLSGSWLVILYADELYHSFLVKMHDSKIYLRIYWWELKEFLFFIQLFRYRIFSAFPLFESLEYLNWIFSPNKLTQYGCLYAATDPFSKFYVHRTPLFIRIFDRIVKLPPKTRQISSYRSHLMKEPKDSTSQIGMRCAVAKRY